MKCEEFDNRIHELLDGRIHIESDTRLPEHADQCPRCRAIWDAYRDLWTGLDAFDPPTLDDDFAEEIVRQVTGGPRTPAKRIPGRMLVVAAIAASLLIAATWIARRHPAEPDQDSQRITIQVEDPPPSQKFPAESPLVDQLQPWPETGPLASIASGKLPLDWQVVLSEDRLDTMTDIAGGIEPITSNLSAALYAIRSAIPLGRPHSTTEATEDSVWLLQHLDGVYAA